AKLFVIELDQGLLSLQVAPAKPDKGAGSPVRGDFAVSIGMLGICFVDDVNFVPEELVEGLEILGNVMGYMGGDVPEEEGDGEISLYFEGLAQRLPIPGYKEGAVVKDNVVQESVLKEYIFKEEFGKLQGIVGGVAGDEDGLFGEAADDDKDGIKAL
ncbi:hypothetical protein C0993_009536, partial [Termitomyces sp. T159_Od127]